MSKGTYEEIQELILKEVDLIEEVSKYIDIEKKGREYVGLSPFKEENTPSFKIYKKNTDYYLFKDFSTGKGGNVIQFVSAIKEIEYKEAMLELLTDYDLMQDIPNIEKKYNIDPKTKIYYNIIKDLNEMYKENLRNNKEYQDKIIERGYEDYVYNNKNDRICLGYALGNEIEKLKEKYDIEDLNKLNLINRIGEGKQKDRIIFPIRNSSDRIVGFGGRGDDKNYKYLMSDNSPIFQKQKNLFTMKSTEKEEPIFLVEGFFDAYALNVKLNLNSCAVMGTALSDEQCKELKKISNEIVLCLDGDEAGQKGTERLLKKLVEHDFTIGIIKMPSGLDPDEYLKETKRYSDEAKIKLKDLLQNNFYNPIEYLGLKYETENFKEYPMILKKYAQEVGEILKLASPIDTIFYFNKFMEKVDIDKEFGKTIFPNIFGIKKSFDGKINNQDLNFFDNVKDIDLNKNLNHKLINNVIDFKNIDVNELKIFYFLVYNQHYDKLETYKPNFDEPYLIEECDKIKENILTIDKANNDIEKLEIAKNLSKEIIEYGTDNNFDDMTMKDFKIALKNHNKINFNTSYRQ